MTVERVSVTPDRMIVRSASGNSVFDTANKYIKTAAAGNLFVNKQVATPLYYTNNSTVFAPIINGAHLRTVGTTEISSGAQVSFKYPEFTGKLSIVPILDVTGGAGAIAVNLIFRIRVYINGSNMVVGGTSFPGVSYRFVLFSGGGGLTVPVGRTGVEVVPDNIFNAGDTITVGGVDQLDYNLNVVGTNKSQVPYYSLGFFAYQDSGTNLPLQVTV